MVDPSEIAYVYIPYSLLTDGQQFRIFF